MSDLNFLLNYPQIIQGDLLAESRHLAHFLPRILYLVNGVLKLVDQRLPHTAAVVSVVLVQYFAKEVAVTITKLNVFMV